MSKKKPLAIRTFSVAERGEKSINSGEWTSTLNSEAERSPPIAVRLTMD
jgi:hypothetical protein